MERNRGEVGDVSQRLEVVDHEISDVALGVVGVNGHRWNPVGHEHGCVLLEEGLTRDAVRIPRQHDRAVAEVRQEQRRDRLVVADQVALCVALRPEDLLQIREANLAGRGGWRRAADARRLTNGLLRARRGISIFHGPLREPQPLFGAAVLGFLVGPQSDERRVPEPAIVGPLGEAYLAYEPRLHPMIPAPAGAADLKRRGRAPERLESLRDLLEPRRVEAGADLGHVDQPRPLVPSHVERAEPRARALRLGIASDHEHVPAVALDLDPVG